MRAEGMTLCCRLGQHEDLNLRSTLMSAAQCAGVEVTAQIPSGIAWRKSPHHNNRVTDSTTHDRGPSQMAQLTGTLVQADVQYLQVASLPVKVAEVAQVRCPPPKHRLGRCSLYATIVAGEVGGLAATLGERHHGHFGCA